jgi:hypothetical protein
MTLGLDAAAFADEAMELAKKKENPIADLTSLSFDNGTSFGAGPVVTLPTATDDALGSRKWGVGPSAAAIVIPGDWVIGVLAQNVWAVAGDTPFSWAKQIASDFGGIRNGMIVHWPKGGAGRGGEGRHPRGPRAQDAGGVIEPR